MIRRFAYMFIGFALLFVSSAEAMMGHCAQTEAQAPAMEMSAHCAEMMGESIRLTPAGDDASETSACCCFVMTVPVLFDVPVGDAQMFSRVSWKIALRAAGQSVPPKVAIPPPRI